MHRARLVSLGLFALAACASPGTSVPGALAPARHVVNARAETTYGYHPKDPIRVGNGPDGEHAYLEALRGPEGQVVVSRRLGSCCEFETPNGFHGWGMLNVYEVTYEGLDEPTRLYLDMYDAGEVRAPEGFMLKGQSGEENAPPSQKVIEL